MDEKVIKDARDLVWTLCEYSEKLQEGTWSIEDTLRDIDIAYWDKKYDLTNWSSAFIRSINMHVSQLNEIIKRINFDELREYWGIPEKPPIL